MKQEILTMKQTALKSAKAGASLMSDIQKSEKQVDSLIFEMHGVQPKASYEEIPPHKLPLIRRLSLLAWTHINSTDPITQTEKQQLKIISESLKEIAPKAKEIEQNILPPLKKRFDEIDAPWTPGR
jgi:hypothetical protein